MSHPSSTMSPLYILLPLSLPMTGQKPEYDFYRDARDKKLEVYAAELQAARVPDNEIARLLHLLKNHRPLLEADWPS